MSTRVPRRFAAGGLTPDGRVRTGYMGVLFAEAGALCPGGGGAQRTTSRRNAWTHGACWLAVLAWAFFSAETALAAADAKSAANEATETVELEPIDAQPAALAGSATAAVEHGLSQAEQLFRQGVELYTKNQYREALNLFNRVLALEPNHEQAQGMRDKCQAKLQVSAAGEDPSATPTFETVTPGATAATPSDQGGAGLSAEELKIQSVGKLMGEAQIYMENQRYRKAAELYEQVLLIAPDNKRALRGLQDATIGVSKENVADSEKEVSIDRAKTREFIEKSKELPEGADPRGIKKYRVTVPVIEEEALAEKTETQVDKALSSPITIDFKEGTHIQTIIDHISQFMDINIIIDKRVVKPPVETPPAQTFQATPGLPGAPGVPGAPGAAPFPGAAGGAPGAAPFPGAQGAPGAYPGAAQFPAQAANQLAGPQGVQQALGGTFVTDGLVPYISLSNVPLKDALRALLRPLNLDYSKQPSFIWISTPERIRTETFEELDTRYFTLKNAGSETMFKVVVQNQGGYVSSDEATSGDFGGSTTTGGSNTSGNRGGTSGNRGGGSNIGGGSSSSASATFSNISSLFTTVSDASVGEPPAVIGLSGGGTGIVTGQQANTQQGGGQYPNQQQQGGQYPGQQQGGQQQGTNQVSVGGTIGILQILRNIIPDVVEPHSGRLLSYMDYNPLTNQLIIHNTPTNIELLKKQLKELDVTPQQVSIESKFLTVKVADLNKTGFTWDVTQSDLNGRPRQIEPTTDTTTDSTTSAFPPYAYDINGDGVAENIPFYTRPDGTNVINNTITKSLLSAVANPGPKGSFSLSGIITDNKDGDRISVVMDYLSSLNETELLSAPRVTTMSGKPAVIADFTTQTYNTNVETELQTANAGFGGTPTVSSAQRLRFETFMFGITLSVTPRVSGDQVRLWLNPQVTSRIGEDTFTLKSFVNGNEQSAIVRYPRTSVQAVWTNVIVHDGDTLVLGGLVSDTTTKDNEKLPYLADIPVLGYFFRGNSKSVDQSSLLIFVTVDIIDPTGAQFFESKM